MEQFTVKIGTVEGPLDLILSLIEERKLPISDVSLAAVTDDYLAYLKRLETLPIADTAHFILVASTLLLIKSRALLPSLDLTGEETESAEDLERRLVAYQRMRELSKHVQARLSLPRLFLPSPRPVRPFFAPPPGLTSAALAKTLRLVIANFPRPERLARAAVAHVVSLEEMIVRLAQRLRERMQMSFREFSGEAKIARTELIVGFLALLELVKRGALMATQEGHFEDIRIETTEVATPRYGR